MAEVVNIVSAIFLIKKEKPLFSKRIASGLKYFMYIC